jgi:hypothetical protein
VATAISLRSAPKFSRLSAAGRSQHTPKPPIRLLQRMLCRASWPSVFDQLLEARRGLWWCEIARQHSVNSGAAASKPRSGVFSIFHHPVSWTDIVIAVCSIIAVILVVILLLGSAPSPRKKDPLIALGSHTTIQNLARTRFAGSAELQETEQ